MHRLILKVKYLRNKSSDLYENLNLTSYDRLVMIGAHRRAHDEKTRARTHISSHVHAFTPRACIHVYKSSPKFLWVFTTII